MYFYSNDPAKMCKENTTLWNTVFILFKTNFKNYQENKNLGQINK